MDLTKWNPFIKFKKGKLILWNEVKIRVTIFQNALWSKDIKIKIIYLR